MDEPYDPNRTVAENRPPDALDAGLAAAFGPAAPAPPHGAAEQPDAVSRYRLFGEIARGGMGAVLRGHDPDLGRDLAVKVLLEKHQGRTEVVRRFVEEAQIGGQLQHPGMVPVYELGQFNGRPYFTMKLVKGSTLAALLRERSDPAQERPRFLKVFEQVCQALAYAHAKGVIHRDLKPANVMVGAFGEVQVMDWGLAKVLARDGGTDEGRARRAGDAETVIRTTRSGPAGSESQAASILGTPAYMSPEQALGEVERLDERCDVFGLGAMLCMILTGHAPYGGSDAQAVRRRAARADLAEAFARLEACGADAELVTLAKRCLAPEPGARPRHAGAVAVAVAAYLAGVEERARRAELDRAAAQARAEEAQAKAAAERRARRLTVGLAAAVLLLAAGGGAVGWRVQQQRAEARQRARFTMDQARAKRDAGWKTNDVAKLADAGADAGRAVDIASAASAEVREEAVALREEIEEKIVAAEKDLGLLGRLPDIRGPREVTAYRKDKSGMLVELGQPSADEQFAEAFRDWGLDIDASPTEVAAARLKARPDAVVVEVVAALDEWASERRGRRRPRADWQRLARLAEALDDAPDPRRRELRTILSRGRLPLERALGELSRALLPWTELTDQVPGEDRNRLRELAQQTDPAAEPVLGLLTLVRALRGAGEDPEAERLLRGAVRARPAEVVLYHALGELLEQQRPPRWAEAVACYAAARALRPELGRALARSLRRAGHSAEGLALDQELTKRRPDNPASHVALGYALWEQNRPKEAEACFRRAIPLKPDYALAHSNLGVVLQEQNRPAEAEEAGRRAIALQPDLAMAHSILGNALREQKRPAEAEEAHRRAVALQPDDAEWQNNLGVVLAEQNRPKEAEACFRRAVVLRPGYATPHSNLGSVLAAQDRLKEAEACFRLAISLQPDLFEGHGNLGSVLAVQNRPAEAEAAYRKAIALKPDLTLAHIGLGAVLQEQGRSAEAEVACRRAIALQPDDALAHINLGNALAAQKRPKEAEAAHRRAIALKPDSAEAHSALGFALFDQNRPAEAEAAHRRAIASSPTPPRRTTTSASPW